MAMTKSGIFYNLSESCFSHKAGTLRFVFSSKTHLEKFKESLAHNRDATSKKLTRRFGFPVRHDTAADIALYRKIETRGFLIYEEGGGVLCLSEAESN